MAVHRYWRVRSGGIESQTVIAELEFANTTGGTDLCTGGTAIASSSYGGSLAPSQAFNNNPADRWASSDGSANCWLGYDLGAGNEAEVNEVRITPSATEGTQCMRWFYVESSDDGSTWTFEWMSLNEGTANTPYSFPRPTGTAPASARFWCLEAQVNQNGASDSVIADIALRTSPGGSNVATGGVPRYYPDNATYAQANPWDQVGSSISYGNEGANPHPTWYWYDLGAGNDAAVVEYWVRAATGGNEVRAPATLRLLNSDDGIGWYRCGSHTAATWTSGSQQTFAVDTPAPPTGGRRRRSVVC